MAITKTDSGKLKNHDKVVTDIGIDNDPTTGSDNLVTSGGIKNALDTKADKSDTYTKQEVNDAIAAATPADYDTVKSQVQQNTQDISGIESKIPAQASAQNQLADKNFVNSSIATNTATFRGTYNLVSDLGLTVSATHEQVAAAIATKLAALSITPENNDYCFVQVPTSDADPTVISRVDRYKCTVTESGGVTSRTWDYEWSLNNSSFTADQWAAINSGITANLVSQISANQVAIGVLNGRDYIVINTSTMEVTAVNHDANASISSTFNNMYAVPDTTYIIPAFSVIFNPRTFFATTLQNTKPSFVVDSAALTKFTMSSITLTLYVKDTGSPVGLFMFILKNSQGSSVATSSVIDDITTNYIKDYTFNFPDFTVAQDADSDYEFFILAKKLNGDTFIPDILFYGNNKFPNTPWKMRRTDMTLSNTITSRTLNMSMDATAYGKVAVALARVSDIAITSVKVNGTALTPDANKAVNVPVPIPATLDLPVIAGTAAVGMSDKFAREDHVHPAETKALEYALPDSCFPVKYLPQVGDERPYVIDSNDGLRFQDAAFGIEMYTYDAEAQGGYGTLLGYFDSTTKKWSSIGAEASITFLKDGVDTAPTANTWPVLEEDTVFVREVQVAKDADVKTALAGKLGNTGDQTLNGTLTATSFRSEPGNGPFATFGITSAGKAYIGVDPTGGAGEVRIFIPYGASGVNDTLALLSDIYAAVQQIAPDFTAKAYALNELCSYNGVVYRCKSAYTATAQSTKPNSDTTHWDAKKVSELFLPLTGGTIVLPYSDDRKYSFAIKDERHGTAFEVLSQDEEDAYIINLGQVDVMCPDGTDVYIDSDNLHLTDKGKLLSQVLALLAPLASPAFTGTPTAPTPTSGDNSTKVATTAFVKTAVDNAQPNLNYVMRVDPTTGNIYYTTPDNA